MEDLRIEANLRSELRDSSINDGNIYEFMSDIADYVNALKTELTTAYDKIEELENDVTCLEIEIDDLMSQLSEMEEF